MRICPFCSKALETVQDGAFISTHVCIGCQKPKYDTIFEETFDKTNGELLNDSFRVNDYYVSRRYKNGLYSVKKSGQNTIINKNVVGYLEDRTAIILSSPVFEFDKVLIFDFSDLERLEEKLNIYALIS